MDLSRLLTSPTKENFPPSDGALDTADSPLKRDAPIRASPSSALPSRSPALSWQRRPNSQSSDLPRSRPLSTVATENGARSPRPTASPEPSSESASDQPLSREQIAQSLASKDPAWFRQTADRGLSSPAYRRNQVEAEDRSDHGLNSSRVQMPGMSHDVSRPERPLNDLMDPSRRNITFEQASRSSEAVGNSSRNIGSPIPLPSAQNFEAPNMDSASDIRGLAMSPSQGRISPERLGRPVSPTKGMGGFVQSAMMKRSDSVNKRWSVQSHSGVSRGNSLASNRSSNTPNTPLPLSSVVNASASVSRPSSLSRDSSPRPSSRPTSSQSNATITDDQRPGTSSSMRSSTTTSTNDDVFVKPSLPASRSQGFASSKSGPDNASGGQSIRDETTPTTSPSKTMNPRRWSPTKSSWLESALNKPESPKPKVAPPQQPAWMSEISKAKQRSSIDLANSPTVGSKHEVNIGGLIRSPPLGGHAKQLTIGGLPAGFSSGLVSKGRSESISSQDSKMAPGKPGPVIKTSPINGSPKPEVPPTKDFRAGLKPRQPLPDSSSKDEPEFKNVFGQLRRTKTQNYVAPDVLKDNITQGKAALNVTGGPQKNERRDEFKDAILKKKEDFKKAQLEGKGVTRSATGETQEVPLPEALAKRNALGRSGSVVAETESPQPSAKLQEISPINRLQGKETVGGKLAGRLNPALAGLLARGPPSVASDTSRSTSQASSQRTISMSTSTTNPDTQEGGPQLTHMTKGRARGPRRKAPTNVPVPVPTSDAAADSKLLSESGADSLGVAQVRQPLQMTKAMEPTLETPPKADVTSQVSEPSSARKLDMKRRSQFLQDDINMNIKEEKLLDSPRPLSPGKKSDSLETSIDLQETDKMKGEPVTRVKPHTPMKSPSLASKHARKSSNKQEADSPETAKLQSLPLSTHETNATETPPKSTTRVDLSKPALRTGKQEPEVSKGNDREPQGSVRGAAASWQRPSTSEPRIRSPIKLPTQEDEKTAMIEAGLRSASPVKGNAPIGLGIQIKRETASPRSLPAPPKNQLSPPQKLSSSSGPPTSEASKLLLDFFGQHDSPPEFLTDTAAILAARQEQGTDIKTLRSSLYQLSSNGKKQLVPPHHERLLFEGNMYICIHAFGNEAGKKVTEVYFWTGDEVPSSTVQGADIFAQREAKSAGGKLIKLQQGKETPEFFQALGGIIIIRRGLSNKYDSLAPHILCGRKHHGQIAFDEVDYSPASLCSGFPFLISTQSGKSYLWKGKGSGVDELSCARLIGMDLGLTGEIEEVEDGKESESFLGIFGAGARIPKSADHWRMKPNYNKYCGRLFRADSSAKSQVSWSNSSYP